MKKHLLWGALVASLLAARPVHAGLCDSLKGVGYLECQSLTLPIVSVGATLYAFQSATFALRPWTSVKVELEDGRMVDGRLSPRAVYGRTVSAGDHVRLVCSQPDRICEIEFMHPTQSSWTFSLSPDGVPDESLLKLDVRPPIRDTPLHPSLQAISRPIP